MNFEIKDRNGKTALDHAIEKNYQNVANLLQSRGAISDAKPLPVSRIKLFLVVFLKIFLMV